MGTMTEAHFAEMKSNVLTGLGRLRKYAGDLSRQKDVEEASKEILGKLAVVERGVKAWGLQGPSNAQRSAFVKEMNDLREFTSTVRVKAVDRSNLLSLLGEVDLLSISGKNCKAPLMLFNVGP